MLEILYDQGPCLVVNKRPGLLTQAPAGIDSLEVQVKQFYRQREGKPADSKTYLGLPHRLDRPVSGAILFARHVRACRRLSSQFENRTVDKVYWALVEGPVEPDEGTWIDYLHKRHGMAHAEVVGRDHPEARHAVLHYRVLQQIPAAARTPESAARPPVTHLEIHLETGRTHQIRVQAGARNHAVLGDEQYGSTRPFGQQHPDLRDRSIALHARQLIFRHPMTDELVDITAPLLKDWDGWLQVE
jgi:23S rRNA pseudouridine1911/1915/1917 synthase